MLPAPARPRITVSAWRDDPQQRENFLVRMYAWHEWQHLLEAGLSRHALTDFHSRYKYLLMAHNPVQYKTLGHLLGDMDDTDLAHLGPRYFTELMAALGKCATRGTHTNALQHISGYLKRSISVEDRQALQHVIHQYHQGIVPLEAPLSLLREHFHHHPNPYIARQVYLLPPAQTLSLRNATQ
jgi:uncharacterized protein YbgA (DUF1722 family)